jgi:gamma-glutamyl:cysteine ligase YbdK (ATP-grasp superfamily)
VPDAQATVEDAEAIVAVIHALFAWLLARLDAGERLVAPATRPLAAARRAAARDGLATDAARDRVCRLLDALEPYAAELGGTRGLARARAIVEEGGAPVRHRALAEEDGLDGLVSALAHGFTAAPPG